MANFLLLIEGIVKYSKMDIDQGKTPPEIYKICSCLREAYCISFGIRKENDIYLYFQNERLLIKFAGNLLRFLGPDERSQALLLNKAIELGIENKNRENDNWIRSTPGIFVKSLKSQSSLNYFIHTFECEHFSFIFDSISALELPFLAHTFEYPEIKRIKRLKNLKNDFFVLSLNPFRKNRLIDFLRLLVEDFPTILDKISLVPLKKVKATEDKILYINHLIDQQQIV